MMITGNSWVKEGTEVWMEDKNATAAARASAGLADDDTSIVKGRTSKVVSVI